MEHLSIQCKFTTLVKTNKIFECKIVNIFLYIHQFYHMFWVLKRTISMRRFFIVPTTHFGVEKQDFFLKCYTLI